MVMVMVVVLVLALGAVVIATFWQRGRQGASLVAAGVTALLITGLQPADCRSGWPWPFERKPASLAVMEDPP